MLWIPWMHPGLYPGQAAVAGREEGILWLTEIRLS